jgi:hypothetical protein
MTDPVAEAIITAAVRDARLDSQKMLRDALPRLKELVTIDPEDWTVGDRLLVRGAIYYLTADLSED